MTRTRILGLTALAALPLLTVLGLRATDAQEGAQEGAQEEAAAGALDEAAVARIVRETLLANPEIVIEAADRYYEAQALAEASAAEEAAEELVPQLARGESGHAMGADLDAAEVVVVEFFDYHCGYCKRGVDFVLDLADADGVRVVLQDLPILREESREAALLTLAAADRGGYPALHRTLMRTAGVLDREALERAARRADLRGLTEVLDDEAARARLSARLDASVEAARTLRIDGTPAFLIARPDGSGARIVPGYDPEAVRDAIEALRAS